MKNKYIQLFMLLTGLLYLNSCSKDFLDIPAQGKLVNDPDTTIPVNSVLAEAELLGAYQPVRWCYPWGMSSYVAYNVASDDIASGGAAASDRPEYEVVDKFTMDPTNDGVTLLWERFYQGVARCNLFISDYKSKTSNDSLVRFVAEAKFLRAYYYFNLVRCYGAIPMPLLPSDGAIAASTINEVYEQMENDLNEAINSGKLPLKSQLDGQSLILSRATLGAAKMLLGKVYVYHSTVLNEPKWDDAYTMLNSVYTSGEYRLNGDFRELWSPHYEMKDGNPENIFEAYYTDEFSFLWGTTHPEGNLDMQLMGIRDLIWSGTFRPLQAGWGFCKPNQKMVDAFISENDSIRLDATVISAAWLTANGATFGEPYDATGYWNGKYRQADAPIVTSVYAQNETIFRFAEVILLLAEVEYNRGNEAAALGFVNEIRSRVKLAPKSSTGSALWADIIKEKQMELALESNRYFDLVRWGMTSEIPNFKSATKGLWPIPLNALLTDNKLTQNEGY
jgi:starch-binding outer membrane protein, SusD/RagB family